ncbi:class I SAM-dependent methyltransferase [Leisingera sp. McT4-56]|uniref:class I SAM-dependent methyltransferase n=1 Tax=Leisingera sp. McT4-56 TaxID=2881255 RepID=UPI001CF90F39|nr:class I SAM-dependent methyltransferase [Leisingera sp. McT4-56]MCB4455132.1 class I SAM-dependent methyltransferase [Leisingera sp. McT4-56]
MTGDIPEHYSGGGNLADRIARDLRARGLEPSDLTPAEFEPLDEFHFRGRAATLELAAQMRLTPQSNVLDIGSGLGGVARTIADTAGCHVTGIDLTAELCAAAAEISRWLGLADKTEFQQGDATSLPFSDDAFDAAITVHVAMNIPAKHRMYSEARRVLRPGALFAVYDILQGEGGEMIFPAPWAAEPSISHLATPQEMETLLREAGFKLLDSIDSTAESLRWLEERTAGTGPPPPVPITTRLLFGEGYKQMVQNQLRALRERRMLTWSFLCEA